MGIGGGTVEKAGEREDRFFLLLGRLDVRMVLWMDRLAGRQDVCGCWALCSHFSLQIVAFVGRQSLKWFIGRQSANK